MASWMSASLDVTVCEVNCETKVQSAQSILGSFVDLIIRGVGVAVSNVVPDGVVEQHAVLF